MIDDDNPLHGVDLGAWEAPPPAAGFADAVEARLSAVPAVEPAVALTPRRRRAFARGAVVLAGAALAAGGFEVYTSRAAAAREGDVVATTPRHLELEDASAELEPGAHVIWRTRDDVLIVEQAGAATWTTHGRLRIETGPGMAPVEATGASLRVEAPVKWTDVRSSGSSVMTSAAVAMTTVMVLHGQVATGGEHPALIAAGPPVELRAGSPPQPVDAHALDTRVRDLQAEVDRLKTQLAITRQLIPAPVPTTTPHHELAVCDEAACLIDDYQSACCVKFKPQSGAPCDAHELAQTGRGQIRVRMYSDAVTSLEASLACAPDPSLEPLVVVAACNANEPDVARRHFANLAPGQRAAAAQTCTRNKIDLLAAPTCNAKARVDAGQAKLAAGEYPSAVLAFELALSCKDDPAVYPLMVKAACKAGDDRKLATYYPKVAVAQRKALRDYCAPTKLPD